MNVLYTNSLQSRIFVSLLARRPGESATVSNANAFRFARRKAKNRDEDGQACVRGSHNFILQDKRQTFRAQEYAARNSNVVNSLLSFVTYIHC